jgi:hypothetical protein
MRIALALALLVAGCGGSDDSNVIDLKTVKTGIYLMSAVVNTTCTYSEPATAPASFDSIETVIAVDDTATAIKVPFGRSAGSIAISIDRIDMDEADGYAYTREYPVDCGASHTMSWRLTQAKDNKAHSTSDESWSSLTATCASQGLPTSDCSTSSTFTYSLKTACAEPCQIVSTAGQTLTHPFTYECQCN